MLGAIIGDIVGSRYEFSPTNDYNFEMFAPGSSFTDDTICTVAVADALLKGIDYGESLHRWCRRYSHPKGSYGGRFRRWVMSESPRPYGSFGNGSAMRVSPVGWWYFDTADVLRKATKTAECTHNHPEGIKGACTVALAISLANKMKNNEGRVDVKALLDECVRFSGYNIDIHRSSVINHFDETCQGTLPVALWIIGKSKSFEDAIRRAVSLGADADTLGAITGSIAEAIWGIPEWMKRKAISYLPSEMKTVLSAFRKEIGRRRKAHAEKEKLMEIYSIMHWKLGNGNMGRFFDGDNPIPAKEQIANRETWNVMPWPEDKDDYSVCAVDIRIPRDAMDILRRGHIPDAQEDHWFMYCDDEYIRYFRSWTGMPAFEAHYKECQDGCVIDSVKMNKGLCEFGVNGDEAGVALFRYLITTETGGDSDEAWRHYLNAWTDLHNMFSHLN